MEMRCSREYSGLDLMASTIVSVRLAGALLVADAKLSADSREGAVTTSTRQ
jgi:hypothetical protein